MLLDPFAANGFLIIGRARIISVRVEQLIQNAACARRKSDMKAMVYTKPKELKILDVDNPRPQPGEALIKVVACGICGSELEGFASVSPRRVPPLIMGHEFSGEVIEVVPSLIPYPSSLIRIGDRVCVNPLLTCGECDLCRSGHLTVCRNRRLISMHRPGAFAEYVAVPLSSCYQLPSDFEMSKGAFVEPTANAVHVVGLGMMPLPRFTLVMGAGTIGLLAAQVARAAGAPRVMVADISNYRLSIAQSIVADAVVNVKEQSLEEALREFTDGAGFDLCVDAVGTTDTRAASVAMIRPGGVASWIGTHAEETTFNGRDIVLAEKSVRGSYAFTHYDFAKAIDLLHAGTVKVDAWSKPFPLTEGVEAFWSLLNGTNEYVKALLQP
jgi:L-iditol 2-dehydrogenase